MAHNVICFYCKKTFDRDKVPYAQVSSRRYAHADCALREHEKNPKQEKPVIIDPNDIVVCIYCKESFNKREVSCKCVKEGKYAHTSCFELEEKRELTDKEKLERYIMKLFDTDYVPARIQKQINEFLSKYNYTYSGMLKALIYFYEIKNNSLANANGGIGIIPYIYDDAYRYYYNLWLIEQSYTNKDISNYIPKKETITIVSPDRKTSIKKPFNFLMEDEEIE